MKHARFAAFLAAASLLGAQSRPTFAWGRQGHEYVGKLASKLLNPNARYHVAQLLAPNLDLPKAADWPDCVRDVDKNASGFRLAPGPKTPQICLTIESTDGAAMVDYASRNWTNCEYSHRKSECHKAFHFADVNVHEHSDYDTAHFGAEPFDVVHAIEAATFVLKCRPSATVSCEAPAPFDIKGKREALLLLAHFVGDVHQPLHAGAVYLDPTTNAETGDTGLETIGGNSLLMSPGSDDNLHGRWDSVTMTEPSAAAIAQACAIAPLPNPTAEPPEKWASESVAAARDAYNNMTFVRDTAHPTKWDIQFASDAARTQYLKDLRRVQALRLVQAGARLASVLNSVWPSTRVAAACK